MFIGKAMALAQSEKNVKDALETAGDEIYATGIKDASMSGQ